MSDETGQKPETITDWTKIQGKVTEFEIEHLDLKKRYVLELVEAEYIKNVTQTYQGESKVVDRFKTVWQVLGHKTRVWQWFNLPAIDHVPAGGVPEYSERLKIVDFSKRTGRCDDDFALGQAFNIGMLIACKLKAQKKACQPDSDDADNAPFYKIDIATVFPATEDAAPKQNDAMPAASVPDGERNGGVKDNPEYQKVKEFIRNFQDKEKAREVARDILGFGDDVAFNLLWNQVVAERSPLNSAEVLGGGDR